MCVNEWMDGGEKGSSESCVLLFVHLSCLAGYIVELVISRNSVFAVRSCYYPLFLRWRGRGLGVVDIEVPRALDTYTIG